MSLIRPIPCRLCGKEVETSETDIHGRCYDCHRDDARSDAKDAELTALREQVQSLTRERDSALERAAASDHLRPEYQADALEQKRLRVNAEAEVETLRREIVAMNSTLQVSHVEWSSAVKRAEAAESLVAELANVVQRESVRQKAHSNPGGTHWDGCHESHDRCAWWHDLSALSDEARAKIKEVSK